MICRWLARLFLGPPPPPSPFASLSPTERAAILARSPYELEFAQGDGFVVSRKGVPGFEGVVDHLGEIMQAEAEDVLIARQLAAERGDTPTAVTKRW